MLKYREHRRGARVALSRLSVELPGSLRSGERSPHGAVEEGFLKAPVTGNISTGGVGFSLKPGHPRLKVGDRVTVRFELPDAFDPILVRAEVRHVTSRPGGGQRVGARFLDADELIENPLFRYIEESLLAIRATSQSFSEGLSVS